MNEDDKENLILLAMAIEGYGYDPRFDPTHKRNSTATARMLQDVKDCFGDVEDPEDVLDVLRTASAAHKTIR